MDIEDLVYNAGRKGRDANGKSKASLRKEAVVNAAVASNLKTILEGKDHSLLTRSQDPALVKMGKALDLRSKTPEVSRSAMASVNLMEDYSGVSPSDIASFRSANPLLEDFAVEVLESVAFDEETRASSSSSKPRRKDKKPKGLSTQAKKVVSGQHIDNDGNFISTPAAPTDTNTGTATIITSASTATYPAHLERRKSFDELNYLYRAQIVKSQQKRPETKQQKLKAELTRKRLARESNQGKLQQQPGSTDDGAGTVTRKSKSRPDMNTLERLAEERRKWRLVETPQDKKRREKQLHDSLIRMFEVQVRLEEEEKARKRALKGNGGGKSGKRRNFFSMFRASSNSTEASQAPATRNGSNSAGVDARGGTDGEAAASGGAKPEKRASLFDSLPRLF